MKDWIVEKFSGLMDDIQNDFNSLEIEASIEGGLNCTEVKVGCSKWWYCADDKFAAQGSDQMRLLPTGDNSDISMCRLESEVRDFYMVKAYTFICNKYYVMKNMNTMATQI